MKDLNPVNECGSEAVCLKGEFYVFGSYDHSNNLAESVEKYSPLTNKWNVLTEMFDGREDFCACAFINKIFIIGGCAYNSDRTFGTTSSCLEFNTKDNNFKEISKMNVARESAACVVFQGNIVVSGGFDANNNELNTVESYDVFADKWTSLPNMLKSKSFHSLVVVKDKMFAFGHGTESCEVFDNVCNKFIALKHQPSITFSKSVSIGNKILIFQENRSSITYYDVDKDEWSEESCEITKHLENFSLTKLPQY